MGSLLQMRVLNPTPPTEVRVPAQPAIPETFPAVLAITAQPKHRCPDVPLESSGEESAPVSQPGLVGAVRDPSLFPYLVSQSQQCTLTPETRGTGVLHSCPVWLLFPVPA